MNKTVKILIWIAIIAGVLMSALIVTINVYKLPELDYLEITDTTNDVTQSWGENMEGIVSKYPFFVMDSSGVIIHGAENEGKSYARIIKEANEKGNVITDVLVEGKLVGKVIFDIGELDETKNIIKVSTIVLSLMLAVSEIIIISVAVYIYLRVHRPFVRMKDFATHVAGGNLDIPLEMDRNNVFGAYTESFDMMREELKRSRHMEYLANMAKKDFISSVSHDLYTPITVIKSSCECLQLQTSSPHIDVIMQKANEMEGLVSDMLTENMEDGGGFTVNPMPMPSAEINKILDYADYKYRVRRGDIPSCMILADKVRLSQSIGNIIANAYKYGGEVINIDFSIVEGCFTMRIHDNGQGINEEELGLVTDKYFRGSNTKDIAGAGLGLYIVKQCIEGMQGEVTFYNDDGFTVLIELNILES